MRRSRAAIILVAAASIILEIIVDEVQCAPTIIMQSLEPKQGGALEQYKKVRSGLEERKREMCSFLLNDLDNRDDENLELDKVTHLFEASLDHLAKTTSYVTLLKPYVKPEVIRNFDTNGGQYVLEISNARRKLIEDYEKAEAAGASDQEKRDLLESYFFKACESKFSTIITEKAMYDTAQKAEKLMRVELLGGDAGN